MRLFSDYARESVMEKLQSYILLILILFIVSGKIASSQPSLRYPDPDKKLVQYISENYTTNDGLPTNSLLHICQTSDGYLWISGYNGLVRFDGKSFVVFNKQNTPAFKTDVIRKLAEDKEGTLWITTQGSGLVSYKKGKFFSHDDTVKLKHVYRAMYIDSENRIWSASPEKGWFTYKNGVYTFLSHRSNLENIEVRAITMGKPGEMWFGTMGEGLYCLRNGIFTIYTKKNGLPNEWIYSLLYDRNNRLWIGTGSGLCFMQHEVVTNVPMPVNATVNSILEDGYGNIWLGTNNGLMRIDAKTNQMEWLSTASGLQYNFINDLCFDFEGTLWISNYKGGLSRIKDGKFTNYTLQSGLKGQVVNAICQIDTQNILVAFDNGFLSTIKNGLIGDYQSPASLVGKRIRHILKDKTGNLWFSTYSGLLKLSKNRNEEWSNLSTGFPDNLIRVSYEDSRGNIWVGTRNAGLVGIMADKKTIVYNVISGLTSNLIMAIEEDRQGNLFIGTSEGDGGLNMLAPNGELKKITREQGFDSDVVFNIYCDYSGNVWIACDGGLYHYKAEKFTLISTRNGLKDDSPYDVIEDNSGNLWLPCSSGIMKIKKLDAIDVVNKQTDVINCQLFNKSDGMNHSECNPTTQSLKTSDGSLFFATIDGLSQINPGLIHLNDYIPPVIIEKLLVDNVEVNRDNLPVFAPGKKRFTFYFTALSFYEPSKVEFKYKLEGFEQDWIYSGNSRSVSYTNLDGGSYVFRVIACNNDGVWNNDGASLPFRVRPFIYKTVWFYVVLTLFLSYLVFLFYRLRIKQLKEKQIRLEKIITERTKEILSKNVELQQQKEEILAQAEQLEVQQRELKASNAMKDKMFSIIAHDLRGPIGNLKSFLEMAVSDTAPADQAGQHRMLTMLTEMAQSSFELLENLLNWSISQRGLSHPNPAVFVFNNLANEVVKQVIHQAKKKNILVKSSLTKNYEVFADENMVRTILRNLLANAIKFTPLNGEIVILGSEKDEFIQIGIRDNGVGISLENQAKLFNYLEFFSTQGTNREKGSGLGLKLCQDFVIKNGGTIWVESEPGNGSTFFFTLQQPPVEPI